MGLLLGADTFCGHAVPGPAVKHDKNMCRISHSRTFSYYEAIFSPRF